ncbi:putative tyrosine carboxypeptidase MATCAP2 [Pelobates fuscus]|uniref:putative tyrosine carboxypeptidase MATCAP2 n=1 Tax=Pelobates fuscus TaxID=191477 RepID=UPI002FE43953
MESYLSASGTSMRMTNRSVSANMNALHPTSSTRNPSIKSPKTTLVTERQKVLTTTPKIFSGKRSFLPSLTPGQGLLASKPKTESDKKSFLTSVTQGQRLLASTPKTESGKRSLLTSLTQGQGSLAPAPKPESGKRSFLTSSTQGHGLLTSTQKSDSGKRSFLPSSIQGQQPLASTPKNDSGKRSFLTSSTQGRGPLASTPKNDSGKRTSLTSSTRGQEPVASKPKTESGKITFLTSSTQSQQALASTSPKTDSGKRTFLTSSTQSQELLASTPVMKESIAIKEHCWLKKIKPLNVQQEKKKFFNSDFRCNPHFAYVKLAPPSALAQSSQASDKFLEVAIDIIKQTLQKYGSYEKFEQVTGGSLLPKWQIYKEIRKYMEKEGCTGEIAVNLTEDILTHASIGNVKGHPKMAINVSMAREHWLKGTLRHEIGTHYFRKINNNEQHWRNSTSREKYGLKPEKQTEEGLATIHALLFDPNPSLCRVALLYYAIHRASSMSFSELFKDLKKYVKDPDTRWYYCLRAKRGLTDTSKPGCYNKDQVYLEGVLHLLRHRHAIDFQLLMAMGKVSYEDIGHLKSIARLMNPRIPEFLQDRKQYMECLENIMKFNHLTDAKLQMLIS